MYCQTIQPFPRVAFGTDRKKKPSSGKQDPSKSPKKRPGAKADKPPAMEPWVPSMKAAKGKLPQQQSEKDRRLQEFFISVGDLEEEPKRSIPEIVSFFTDRSNPYRNGSIKAAGGQTPLSALISARTNSEKIITILDSLGSEAPETLHGINFAGRDDQGKTVFDYALEKSPKMFCAVTKCFLKKVAIPTPSYLSPDEIAALLELKPSKDVPTSLQWGADGLTGNQFSYVFDIRDRIQSVFKNGNWFCRTISNPHGRNFGDINKKALLCLTLSSQCSDNVIKYEFLRDLEGMSRKFAASATEPVFRYVLTSSEWQDYRKIRVYKNKVSSSKAINERAKQLGIS